VHPSLLNGTLRFAALSNKREVIFDTTRRHEVDVKIDTAIGMWIVKPRDVQAAIRGAVFINKFIAEPLRTTEQY
jgi:hypothetical protein